MYTLRFFLCLLAKIINEIKLRTLARIRVNAHLKTELIGQTFCNGKPNTCSAGKPVFENRKFVKLLENLGQGFLINSRPGIFHKNCQLIFV